jgi:hypothetical protein
MSRPLPSRICMARVVLVAAPRLWCADLVYSGPVFRTDLCDRDCEDECESEMGWGRDTGHVVRRFAARRMTACEHLLVSISRVRA